MKPEHSFFRMYQNPEEYSKLYQKSARFSEWSAETIGFLLVGLMGYNYFFYFLALITV